MSERAEANREYLRKAVGERPFKPFWIRLESGDRLDVKHPENVGFDPENNGSVTLNVVTRNQIGWTTLDAVTGISTAENVESVAGESNSAT